MNQERPGRTITETRQPQLTMGAISMGGDDSIGKFYMSQYGRLVNLSKIITGDRDRAEEVVQGVFLSGLRILRNPGERSSIPADNYFTRAVVNRSMGSMRRRKIREIPAGDSIDLSLLSNTDSQVETYMFSRDPQEIFEERRSPIEDFDDLISGVQSAGQQLILILTYVDQLTETEVARLLNIPVGTVKSYLYRGRETIRKLSSHEYRIK
jgi:RNA polymerase sigma-70 factor (ECF subfamily)